MPDNDNTTYYDFAIDHLNAAKDFVIDQLDIGQDLESVSSITDRIDAVNTGLEAGNKLKNTPKTPSGTRNAGWIDALNGWADGLDNGATEFEAFSSVGIGTQGGFSQ